MPAQRTLYVVVHGVGDQAPGETLQSLAAGLTFNSTATAVTEDRLWLPEPDPEGLDDRTARAFPVPILRDTPNSRVLAEVHWADLSRFPVSSLGLVEGLFTLLFGLRYIAYQAAHGLPDPAAKALRWLGRWATLLLIGPLAASNVLGLFLLVAAVAVDKYEAGAFAGPAGGYAAAAACGVALFVGVVLCAVYGGNEVRRVLGRSLAAVAAGVLVVGWSAQTFGFDDAVWRLPGLHVFYDRLIDARLPTGGIVPFAAITTVPMGVAFIGSNVLVAAAAVLFLVRFSWRRASLRNAALTAAVLPFATLFGWCVVISLCWSVAAATVPGSDPLRAAFKQSVMFGLPTLSYWFLLLGALGLTGLVVALGWLWRRYRLSRSAGRFGDDDGKRLIVAPLLLLVLSAGCLAVEVIVLARHTPAGELVTATAVEQWWEARFNSAWDGVLAILAVAVPIVAAQALPYLRSGLDLVYDVMTHFQFRFHAPPVARPVAGDAGGGGESIDAHHGPEFPIRRAIEYRLRSVIRYFAGAVAADDGPKCRLVVLSHSQGTMAAVEVLNDAGLTADLARFSSVQLVTMGSPFTHIYQHYFGHHYPSLTDDYWATLRARVADNGHWLNLYRVDDYVGRVIEPGSKLVDNRPVPCLGHTGYWFDRDVLRILAELNLL